MLKLRIFVGAFKEKSHELINFIQRRSLKFTMQSQYREQEVNWKYYGGYHEK